MRQNEIGVVSEGMLRLARNPEELEELTTVQRDSTKPSVQSHISRAGVRDKKNQFY